MYFHAKLSYSDGNHFWWNYSKEEMIMTLVVPFINGQIVPANLNGYTCLLNMKNVTFLRIYKTQEKLIAERGFTPADFDHIDFELNDCTQEIIETRGEIEAASNAKSLLQKAFSLIEDQVFVVMKFGDRFLDSAYYGAIKPVIQEFGFKAIRIDEIPDSGSISDQILEAIAKSRYVLADLSGEKPNCYYETGFAHALGKELILCIRKDEVIHFDVHNYRFIVWETEEDLRNALRKRFESIKIARAI
jgi:hypothetical protein